MCHLANQSKLWSFVHLSQKYPGRYLKQIQQNRLGGWEHKVSYRVSDHDYTAVSTAAS